MTFGEHQKSCASNLLVSIKYLMVASGMLVLLRVRKCKFENLPISSSSFEDNMLKISH